MPLTTDELNWVSQHMDIYKIPYQEVHDEVLDHILSAIEQAREAGNDLAIERLFQNVVDEHFNGYIGIDEIVQVQEKAYRKKINRIFWRNYRSILDWKAITFILIAMVIAHFLPIKTMATKLLLVVIFIAEFVPIIYAYVKTRIIKVSKGKKSLLRRHLLANGYIPFAILNLYLNIPNCIDDINDNRDLHFWILAHPEVAALVMALTIIYSISSVYLCRQELQAYKLSA